MLPRLPIVHWRALSALRPSSLPSPGSYLLDPPLRYNYYFIANMFLRAMLETNCPLPPPLYKTTCAMVLTTDLHGRISATAATTTTVGLLTRIIVSLLLLNSFHLFTTSRRWNGELAFRVWHRATTFYDDKTSKLSVAVITTRPTPGRQQPTITAS